MAAAAAREIKLQNMMHENNLLPPSLFDYITLYKWFKITWNKKFSDFTITAWKYQAPIQSINNQQSWQYLARSQALNDVLSI